MGHPRKTIFEEDYTHIQYAADLRLIRAAEELNNDSSEEEIKDVLAKRYNSIRTGPGQDTTRNGQSFSNIESGKVSAAQAYKIVQKEAQDARKRTTGFRKKFEKIGLEDASIDDLAEGIHILRADIENSQSEEARNQFSEKADSALYGLGQILVTKSPKGPQMLDDQILRNLGYELANEAYHRVQPKLI
ncbi:MAG: hypothetical protein GY861_27715 [bacterium]|nr:hypothetical protein [bacterium]